jgi:hypothetical protein
MNKDYYEMLKDQILKRLENYDIFDVIEMAAHQGITYEQMYGHHSEFSSEDMISANSLSFPILVMDTLDEIHRDRQSNLQKNKKK